MASEAQELTQKQISIRLPESLRLESIAKAEDNGISLNTLVIVALKQLNRQEYIF